MRYPLIYGTIAGVIIIVVSWPFLWSGLVENERVAIVIGYLIMVAGLTMIFVGVKRYRDMELGGVIGFGRALGLGLGIAAVASLIYVLAWEAYLLTPAGDGLVDMFDATIVPGYRSLPYRMWITVKEILPVDAVMALLSAAILQNPRVLPARG